MRKIKFIANQQDWVSVTKEWEKLWSKLSDCNNSLGEYVNNSCSTAQKLKLKPVITSWESFKETAQNYYNYLIELEEKQKSVSKIEVELPFEGEDFKEAWQYWKDYLAEQHHIYLQSRTEVKQLKFLKQYSDGDIEKAKEILDYAISRFYLMFFKLDEKKKDKGESSKSDDDGEY